MDDRHETLVRELATLMQRGEDAAAVEAFLTRVAADDRETVRTEARRHADATSGREGATEEEVGDTRGPGPGFDDEPDTVKTKGGVIT